MRSRSLSLSPTHPGDGCHHVRRHRTKATGVSTEHHPLVKDVALVSCALATPTRRCAHQLCTVPPRHLERPSRGLLRQPFPNQAMRASHRAQPLPLPLTLLCAGNERFHHEPHYYAGHSQYLLPCHHHVQATGPSTVQHSTTRGAAVVSCVPAALPTRWAPPPLAAPSRNLEGRSHGLLRRLCLLQRGANSRVQPQSPMPTLSPVLHPHHPDNARLCCALRCFAGPGCGLLPRRQPIYAMGATAGSPGTTRGTVAVSCATITVPVDLLLSPAAASLHGVSPPPVNLVNKAAWPSIQVPKAAVDPLDVEWAAHHTSRTSELRHCCLVVDPAPQKARGPDSTHSPVRGTNGTGRLC